MHEAESTNEINPASLKLETNDNYTLMSGEYAKSCPFKVPLVTPNPIGGGVSQRNQPCTSDCAHFRIHKKLDNYVITLACVEDSQYIMKEIPQKSVIKKI